MDKIGAHMKKRKQLPAFGYLSNITVDIPALIKQLEDLKLLDWKNYNCCRFSTADHNYQGLIAASHITYNSYFKEDSADLLESEKFRQVQLTEFIGQHSDNPVPLDETSFVERVRRLDQNHPAYLPEADELNYGRRGPLVVGEIGKIFDRFQSRITRARFNYLAAGHEIKPHIDYDPSFITRYHIPVITNPRVRMFIEKQGQQHEQYLPADGRVYFFNAGFKHWVKNQSDKDRLHLIVDVHGQKELDHLIEL
jgi:aspartyl/asparaginyl beta-hydroxylase (cupin superfamily)